MSRRLVVLASGATERLALPHLLGDVVQHLEVRVPPRHGPLQPGVAEKLVRAAWFGAPAGRHPDKFVILVDADAREPEEAVRPFEGISERLADIPVPILPAAAKWHLEAWFFADEQGLRGYLGRDLGKVDASKPDAIRDPKRHLINLFDGLYTAQIAGEIARSLRPHAVRGSPSFQAFEACVRNGGPRGSASG